MERGLLTGLTGDYILPSPRNLPVNQIIFFAASKIYEEQVYTGTLYHDTIVTVVFLF